jgi:hypothetical protein
MINCYAVANVFVYNNNVLLIRGRTLLDTSIEIALTTGRFDYYSNFIQLNVIELEYATEKTVVPIIPVMPVIPIMLIDKIILETNYFSKTDNNYKGKVRIIITEVEWVSFEGNQLLIRVDPKTFEMEKIPE